MNRRRCPWCGKRIDKKKDKIFWRDVIPGHSMLHTANCAHCGHKYGQIPLFPYVWKIGLLTFLIFILSFVFKSGVLFVGAAIPCALFLFMPYSKLDDKGRPCEFDESLEYQIKVLDKYGKIKRDELYFLNNCIDSFEPFSLVAPICIRYIHSKTNIILGEFLYIHKQNYDFIERDSCDLYDTEMNLIAKIKFITKEPI